MMIICYNVLMESFLMDIAPICLSAMGGAILIISIWTLLGKADILMDFEHKHFQKSFLKMLAKVESIFGLLISFVLFFLASTILFEKPEKTSLALIILGALVALYLVLYIIFWNKKSKK